MEYIVKNCPECKGELHIPKDIKTCICMYCGKPIDLTVHTAEEMQETPFNTVTDYNRAIEGLADLLQDYEFYVKHFTKDSYSSSFEKYVQVGSILMPIERYSAVSESNKEEAINITASELVNLVGKAIDENTKGYKKSQKGNLIYQYRFFLAVYTVPMIRYLNLEIGERLSDKLVEVWCKKFPDSTFYKADYNDLLEGFNKKGWCFITTAVCDVLGKEEDCYELKLLRSFRDNYMMQTAPRKTLVNEYYQIAPAIVACINTMPDREVIYTKLWQEHLRPCIEDIEKNRLEECKDRYSRMMLELKQKYYFNLQLQVIN